MSFGKVIAATPAPLLLYLALLLFGLPYRQNATRLPILTQVGPQRAFIPPTSLTSGMNANAKGQNATKENRTRQHKGWTNDNSRNVSKEKENKLVMTDSSLITSLIALSSPIMRHTRVGLQSHPHSARNRQWAQFWCEHWMVAG